MLTASHSLDSMEIFSCPQGSPTPTPTPQRLRRQRLLRPLPLLQLPRLAPLLRLPQLPRLLAPRDRGIRRRPGRVLHRRLGRKVCFSSRFFGDSRQLASPRIAYLP